MQRDRRGPGRVVEDLLIGRAQGGTRPERLSGAGVAAEQRVGPARYLQPDPVAGAERVGGRPHGHVELEDAVLVLVAPSRE